MALFLLFMQGARAEVQEKDIDVYYHLITYCATQGMEAKEEEARVASQSDGYESCSWAICSDITFSVIYTSKGDLAYYELRTLSSEQEFSMLAVGLMQCVEQSESANDVVTLLNGMIGDLNGEAGIATRQGAQAMYALSMLPITGNSLRIFRHTEDLTP